MAEVQTAPSPGVETPDAKPQGARNYMLLAQLLVTTVAGTGLTLVLQAIGEDYSDYARASGDPAFSIGQAARYGLAFWFTAHLVGAYLLNEALERGSVSDLVFDIIQSILGFVALFHLGFVTKGAAGPDFAVPCFMIAVIAALGFVYSLLGLTAASDRWSSAQVMRLIVTGASAAGGLYMSLTCVVICWAALILYWCLRSKELESRTKPPITFTTTAEVEKLLKTVQTALERRLEKVETAAAPMDTEKLKTEVEERIKARLSSLVEDALKKAKTGPT